MGPALRRARRTTAPTAGGSHERRRRDRRGRLTGLWTAYYLLRADPTLRVVVLEAETAGFGASGRNGGWCSALFPTSLQKVAASSSREAAVALLRAMQSTVDEIGAVVGGRADRRRLPQGRYRRARPHAAAAAARGSRGRRVAFLGLRAEDRGCSTRPRLASRLGATDVLGGTYTPHCAAIHPARLVRGLARSVERLGATIHEGTPATSLAPGRGADRARGRAGRASWCARRRATPPPARRAPGRGPGLLLMIATEPLPPAFWDADRSRRGGDVLRRPPPDHLRPAHRRRPARVRRSRRAVPLRVPHRGRLRPRRRGLRASCAGVARRPVPRGRGLRDHPPLGRAARRAARLVRRRSASTPRTGIGWAGGYVGDGVATTNLAGRTLADLSSGRTPSSPGCRG